MHAAGSGRSRREQHSAAGPRPGLCCVWGSGWLAHVGGARARSWPHPASVCVCLVQHCVREREREPGGLWQKPGLRLLASLLTLQKCKLSASPLSSVSLKWLISHLAFLPVGTNFLFPCNIVALPSNTTTSSSQVKGLRAPKGDTCVCLCLRLHSFSSVPVSEEMSSK